MGGFQGRGWGGDGRVGSRVSCGGREGCSG